MFAISVMVFFSVRCKSYNHCGRNLCQLNSVGLIELRQIDFGDIENENIAQDESCVYIGLKRSSVPECREGLNKRSIQNDSEPNYCGINLKRVDGLFTKREFYDISINTSYEFKGYTYQQCRAETALNGGGCPEANRTEHVWVKWSDEKMPSSQKCQKYCKGR